MAHIEEEYLDEGRINSIIEAYEKALYNHYKKEIEPVKDIFEQDKITYDVFTILYQQKLDENKEEIRLRLKGNQSDLEKKLTEMERYYLATLQFLKDRKNNYPAITATLYEIIRSVGFINEENGFYRKRMRSIHAKFILDKLVKKGLVKEINARNFRQQTTPLISFAYALCGNGDLSFKIRDFHFYKILKQNETTITNDQRVKQLFNKYERTITSLQEEI